MTEYTLGYLAVGALSVCVIDSILWMLGGRKGKWKRRYVGSGIQTLGINVISIILSVWSWQLLLILPAEILSRSKGYGGDTTNEKIIRRTVFALFSLLSGVILAWAFNLSTPAITILICQAVASVASIIIGVKNPVPAAVEEVFVCFSLKYINYLYMFIV